MASQDDVITKDVITKAEMVSILREHEAPTTVQLMSHSVTRKEAHMFAEAFADIIRKRKALALSHA